jgi:pimeloyl-ACP methyl ester carboxylesterase
VLIHGYNVNRVNGEDGFKAFAQLLQNRGVPEVSVLGQVVGFLWPGDEDIKFISGLFYPAKMGAARDSAALLTRFILGLRGPNGSPVQVILVAHSLGNRVALETVNDLLVRANRTWGRMEGLCLMAAAVTVSMTENGGRLSPASKSLRTRNMFSEADNILHWAFPPGETAAGEGFFPQAVGRFGNPMTVWNEKFDLQPYDHGNYFTGLRSNDKSAQYVAQFLGAAISTQPATNHISSNPLPSANDVPSRRIGA